MGSSFTFYIEDKNLHRTNSHSNHDSDHHSESHE
jgi:hypothetical protein